MRILFVTATRIGDCILSTGLLGALLDRHHGAAVTIACGAPARSLFADVPGLERLIVMRKQRWLGHWIALWRDVAGTRWDIAVDLRGSLTTSLIRRGAALVDRGRLPGLHRVEELGRLAGIDPPPAPRLWLSAQRRARAAALIPGDVPVLALGPVSNWPPKSWPAERFLALVRHLTGPGGRLAGGRVLIAAAPGERDQLAPLLDGLPRAQWIDLAGGDDLLDVAACIARARLYVGNDSGLMHLAAAMGVPTLGLFGPTDERRYGPWGPHALALRGADAARDLLARAPAVGLRPGALMEGLGLDQVAAAAESLFDRTRI